MREPPKHILHHADQVRKLSTGSGHMTQLGDHVKACALSAKLHQTKHMLSHELLICDRVA